MKVVNCAAYYAVYIVDVLVEDLCEVQHLEYIVRISLYGLIKHIKAFCMDNKMVNEMMGNEMRNLLMEQERLAKRLRVVEKRIAMINDCEHVWSRVRLDSLYSESYSVCTKCDARK